MLFLISFFVFHKKEKWMDSPGQSFYAAAIHFMTEQNPFSS
jgi:hypothetical protein